MSERWQSRVMSHDRAVVVADILNHSKLAADSESDFTVMADGNLCRVIYVGRTMCRRPKMGANTHTFIEGILATINYSVGKGASNLIEIEQQAVMS